MGEQTHNCLIIPCPHCHSTSHDPAVADDALTAAIEQVLAAHADMLVRRGEADRRGVQRSERECECGAALPWSPADAGPAHRAHQADQVAQVVRERGAS